MTRFSAVLAARRREVVGLGGGGVLVLCKGGRWGLRHVGMAPRTPLASVQGRTSGCGAEQAETTTVSVQMGWLSPVLRMGRVTRRGKAGFAVRIKGKTAHAS